jgi:hypothetical protein
MQITLRSVFGGNNISNSNRSDWLSVSLAGKA